MNVQQDGKYGSRILGNMAFAALTLALSACGGGGSSGSSGSTKPGSGNPVPALYSLSPSAMTAGSAATMEITIHGSGFTKQSSVNLTGNPIQPRYISKTEIKFSLPILFLTNPGTYEIDVSNPKPGGGSSNSLNFDVAPYALPVIKSITPQEVTPGNPGFTLTVDGSGFSTQSAILYDQAALDTTFVSDTELTAPIPATTLASASTGLITVMNPYPYGSISQTAQLRIGYNTQIINQTAVDMVLDPTRNLIYLSVPDTAPKNPNTIAVLDPSASTITSSYYAGSSPDKLALSSDDKYLYVGLDGANAIQRFVLPGFSKDISIPLGANSFNGPYWAMDIAAAPGAPHTIAVTLGNFNVTPEEEGGVVIFDDATPRTNSLPGFMSGGGYLFDSIVWGSTDTALYAANTESTGADFYTATVDSNGVTLDKDYGGVFNAFDGQLYYLSSAGLVYSNGGQAINPATGTPVGKFPAAGIMTPVAALNKAFFVGQTQSQFGSDYYTVESFNLSQYTPIAAIVIGPSTGSPSNIVAWSNGLVISMSNGQIFNITGQFFSSPTSVSAKNLLQPRVLYNTWMNAMPGITPGDQPWNIGALPGSGGYPSIGGPSADRYKADHPPPPGGGGGGM